MRILQIQTYHFHRGGDSTYMFNLSRLLEERGHEVVHFGDLGLEGDLSGGLECLSGSPHIPVSLPDPRQGQVGIKGRQFAPLLG